MIGEAATRAPLDSEDMNETLLLTATIRPGNVIYCERREWQTRLRDYLFAFRFWLGEPLIKRIVFVENSGADLSLFRGLCEKPRFRGKEVELLSFRQPDFDPNLGKSYGEAKILEHALENSRLIDDQTFVLKGTGRYFATNFFRVWPLVRRAGFPDVMANFYGSSLECDSRYFGANTAFLRNFFLPAAESINDSKQYAFEHALAEAIVSAVQSGRAWRQFPSGGFLVDGVQASTNTAFQYPRMKRTLYRLVATLRNRVPFRFRLGAPLRKC